VYSSIVGLCGCLKQRRRRKRRRRVETGGAQETSLRTRRRVRRQSVSTRVGVGYSCLPVVSRYGGAAAKRRAGRAGGVKR